MDPEYISRDEMDQYLNLSLGDQAENFKNADDLTAWVLLLELLQNPPVHHPEASLNVKNPTQSLYASPRRAPNPFNPEIDNLAHNSIQNNAQRAPSAPNCYFRNELPLGCAQAVYVPPDDVLEPLPGSGVMVSSTSNIKSKKKKQNRTTSSVPPIHIDEWLVMDNNNRRRRPLLHEFLRQLLDNPNYSDIAEYVDKDKGIFKFYQRRTAAELWQSVKQRNSDSSK